MVPGSFNVTMGMTMFWQRRKLTLQPFQLKDLSCGFLMEFVCCPQSTDMNDYKQIIEDLNRYCSPKSLLIIRKHGHLERLYCPFNVKAKRTFHSLQADQICQVSSVLISNDLMLLYVIAETAYP